MKLSIVIPSYNYECYLPEAIESVLSQSFSDFELVIVDDASTDGSLDIAQEYAKQDKRIRIIEHKQNQGIYQTVLDGFKSARGYYFHGLSADDKYLPGFLDKTLSQLEMNPQISLCCSDNGYFYNDKPNHILTKQLLPKAEKPHIFSSEDLISICSKNRFWISGHTVIAKKETIEKYGFYNPKLHSWMDWFLFNTIALNEGIAYIPETLTAMRFHPNTYSSSCNKKSVKQEIVGNTFRILRQPENSEIKKKFRQSALLGYMFKDFQVLKYPSFWNFYPLLIRRYFFNRQEALLAQLDVATRSFFFG